MTTPWRGNELVPTEYMPIQHAYAWVELVVDAEASNGDNSWLMLNNGKRSPDKVAAALQRLAAELVLTRDKRKDTEAQLRAMRLVITEMTHPLFLTYIAGKMGAC